MLLFKRFDRFWYNQSKVNLHFYERCASCTLRRSCSPPPYSKVKATSLSSTDSAQVIASTSKTTPTTASISTTTPNIASTVKSVTRQFVAPPSEATMSQTETSTISAYSGKRQSPVLWRDQLIRPIRPFRVMVKLTVLLVMTRWRLPPPPFPLLPLRRRRELALSTHASLHVRQKSKW